MDNEMIPMDELERPIVKLIEHIQDADLHVQQSDTLNPIQKERIYNSFKKIAEVIYQVRTRK